MRNTGNDSRDLETHVDLFISHFVVFPLGKATNLLALSDRLALVERAVVDLVGFLESNSCVLELLFAALLL